MRLAVLGIDELLFKAFQIIEVTGPQQGEALIREVWATIAANTAATTFARKLIKTVVLAPIAWLLIAPLFGLRLPGLDGAGGKASPGRTAPRPGFPRAL